MTSREKIALLAEQLLALRAPDMVTRSLMALAPQLLRRLPDDDAVLDHGLYELAAVALMLRSDNARPMIIGYADASADGDDVPELQWAGLLTAGRER